MPLLADEHRTRSETLRKPSATSRAGVDIAKLMYKCLDEEKLAGDIPTLFGTHTTSSYLYHTLQSELLFLQLV